jgi:hypothetical protein
MLLGKAFDVLDYLSFAYIAIKTNIMKSMEISIIIKSDSLEPGVHLCRIKGS